MSRRRPELREAPPSIRDRIRSPTGIILGSHAEVVHLVESLFLSDVTCYQMDLYPAGRIQESLGDKVHVVTAPDLWDLPSDFNSLIYLPSKGGERELKLDVIEQAYHVLQPQGVFLVWSPYEDDGFFPTQLKKVFGKVHSYATENGTVLTCHRTDDRPRRRHEVNFQSKIGDRASCRFVTRPGTFSYGKFDLGARALMETARIESGDRVLDLGCGCGTNGTFAWQLAAPDGHITFVDSNLRALALTEMNAKANGVSNFETIATTRVEGLKNASYDVVLANPPYFAQSAIARLFVERGRELLKPGGRFYLVTKQPNETVTMMADLFTNLEAFEIRGYVILTG